ncbi:hypothetical protein D3C74_336550 [compost metagenome]
MVRATSGYSKHGLQRVAQFGGGVVKELADLLWGFCDHGREFFECFACGDGRPCTEDECQEFGEQVGVRGFDNSSHFTDSLIEVVFHFAEVSLRPVFMLEQCARGYAG